MRVSSSFVVPLIVVVALLSQACDRPAQPTQWGGTVDTLPSGTVVVNNPDIPLWNPSEEWRIEEVLRLGELDGTGPDVFGSIGAFEVGRNGELYIFDDQANELRTFSADGHYKRTVGRTGAGPGEYRNVIGMDFTPEGDLLLVDATNARYTTVYSDGTVSSFRRPFTVYQLPWLGGFDVNGMLHDQATEQVDNKSVDVLLRMRTDGEVMDTFRLPSADLKSPHLGTMTFPVPFAPRLLRTFDREPAVWTAVTSEYRIARVALSGDTTVVVTRAMEPRLLSADQRDSVETYLRKLEAQFPVAIPAQARPAHVAPLRWFILGDEDYLWVCATGLDSCTALDVFAPDRRWLGTVKLPVVVQGSPRPLVRGGYLYAVTEGVEGEAVLFKGRVVRP